MNKTQFEYSNIKTFHNKGLLGKDIKIAVFECESPKVSKHAEWVMEVINMVAPKAKIKLFILSSHKKLDEQFKEVIDEEYDLINFSLIGMDISYSKYFNVLADKAFIVASSGNTGKEEYHYPSSIDKCLSVGATYNGKVIASYSTTNDRVDIVNFTGIDLKDGTYFKGTSCSAPYTTGMLALYMELYIEKFGRKPMIGEITEYVMENCKDMYEEGKDNKTGYGMFILNENIREKIWNWKEEKYVDKEEWFRLAKEKSKNKKSQ